MNKQFIYDLCANRPDQTLLVLTRNKFEFAKAFWGEEDKYIKQYAVVTEGQIEDYMSVEDYNKEQPKDIGWQYYQPEYEWNNRGWQYHLQHIVLEENPIEYLKKFL